MQPRPLATLLCTFALSAALPATTFSTETTGDLVRSAEVVCCVLCEEVEARPDPRTGIVFTHVRLRLLEDMKGRADASLFELRIVGGRAGDVETVVPGMPRFEPGRESVLLLGARNRDGFRVVLQARRGMLPLVRDREGERCLGAPVTGLEELGDRRRVTLGDFRAAVKRIVAEQARERGR